MKQVLLVFMAVFTFAVCAQADPALASFNNFFGGQQDAPPEPPQELPPLPDAAQPQPMVEQQQSQPDVPVNASDYYQQQQRQFPPLPPARPCTTADMVGIWRLLNVYEEPSSTETANFSSLRYQYVLYKKDSTYGKYNSPNTEVPASIVVSEIDKQARGLHQYLVNDSGIVYFYNQGVAVDSMACFIVANQRGPFSIGEMLLMPPKGQSKSRLVKVYVRYGSADNRQNQQVINPQTSPNYYQRSGRTPPVMPPEFEHPYFNPSYAPQRGTLR